ncbi:MAG: DUF362 domain-containing protein [Burkholderiales bacterium]
MTVLVQQISSYDTDVIRNFVKKALRLDESLASALRPRDREPLVVVKPNWVREAHQLDRDVWMPVITHPTVVLAVVEALAEALEGAGTIAICDAPITYADFSAILKRGDLEARLAALRSSWPGVRVELIDLRRETWTVKDDVVVERRPNPPDPRGYVALDLGRDSLFYGHQGEGRYYGADYDAGVVNRHHHGLVQEYLVSGTAIACDLFVNVAKLKTHKKTGITCCLKNLVGINGDKNWLPHHTEGSPGSGGDEFPKDALAHSLESQFRRLGRRAALELPLVGPWALRHMRSVGMRVLGDSLTTIRNGNWRGNDTCWRMALDLNRALLYGNSDGSLRDAVSKPYLGIVDGIVGGEGNGPLCPDAVASGIMLAGVDPAAVDAIACRLMGFEPGSLPLVEHAFDSHRWPIAGRRDVDVVDAGSGATTSWEALRAAMPRTFRPHFGWSSRPGEYAGAGLSQQ